MAMQACRVGMMKKIAVFIYTLAMGVAVHANPELNQVTAGDATVTQTQNTTTINQTSDKAILEWNSFNVGANETTHFQQPQGGVALNRINPGQGPSQIFGTLTATGKVILVNQAGIFFGPGARVDVGGIIASTSDISNENFLAGKYIFDRPSQFGGSIVNEGHIKVASYGLAALLGDRVTNNGYIEAKLGGIVLASGSKFTISFDPDQLINFAIDQPASANGKVTNTGTLLANGGTIVVTAQAAKNVLDDVIDMRGVAIAHSVGVHNGVIYIGGGSSGRVHISGRLIASSKRHTGGTIHITGNYIYLASTAVLNANGALGGGTINVGGNALGAGPLPNASAVLAEVGSRISASATQNGNGGHVVVWSDDDTEFHGSIFAQGAGDGAGGSVETSGHYLDVAMAVINLLSPNGIVGAWLLDPSDLTINTSTTTANFASNTYSPNGSNSILNVTDLQNALATANITVQTTASGTGGNGDIFVNAAIAWSSGNTLTLSAFRNVTVASSTTITNTGGGSVVLRADNAGGVGSVGTVSFGTSSNVALSGGSGTVSIYYNPTTFGTQQTLYTGGTTPTSYMLILGLGTATDSATTASLGALSNNSSLLAAGKNYALAQNIDASATGAGAWNGAAGFAPIASLLGSFDGQGFTISHVTINRSTTASQALFSSIGSSGTIKNLVLSSIAVTGGNGSATLASGNSGTVNNVTVGGTLNSPTSAAIIGGLIATNAGTIKNASSSVTVTSTASSGAQAVGGLVGTNSASGSIIGSSSSGTVSGGNNSGNGGLGGLVGINNGSVTTSFSTSTVVPSLPNLVLYDIGGLIGYNTGANAVISNVYYSGNINIGSAVNNNVFYVGGLIGNNLSTNPINGSAGTFGPCAGSICSMGSITSSSVYPSIVGGLIGNNTASITGIANTFTSVFGQNVIGGLIGSNNGALTNVSSATIVFATRLASNAAGGLVGNNNGSISNASSSGTVHAANSTLNTSNGVGGLIGVNTASGTLNNVFSTSTIDATSGGVSNYGGLIGVNAAAVTNAYYNGAFNLTAASGAINYVGGFIGYNVSTTALDGSGAAYGPCPGSICALSTYATAGVLASNIGAFIGTNTGVVRNISIANATVTGNSQVGGFIGNNSGAISNVILSNVTVAGNFQTGGLVGQNNANITNSSVRAGTVTLGGSGQTQSGGFVGASNGGALTNDYTNANIVMKGTGSIAVGGFIGQMNGGSATFAYTTGNITLTATGNQAQYIGGFVGNQGSATIDGSGGNYGPCTGSVCATGNLILVGNATVPINAGGFVGAGGGTIMNVTNHFISVTGNSRVGGFAGTSDGSIINSSSTTNVIQIGVSGQNYVGGFVGLDRAVNGSSYSNDFSSGTITIQGTVANIGGFIGGSTTAGVTYNNLSTTSNIIFTSTASGDTNVGGFVGFISSLSNYASGNTLTNNNTITYSSTMPALPANVGGFVGENDGTLVNATSNGMFIMGSSYVGALVGLSKGTLTGGASNNTFASIGAGTANVANMASPTQFTITGPTSGNLSNGQGVLYNFTGITNYIGNGSTTVTFAVPAVYNNSNNTATVGNSKLTFSGIAFPTGAVSLTYLAAVNNIIVNTVTSTQVSTATPSSPYPDSALMNTVIINNLVNSNINFITNVYGSGQLTADQE